LFKKPDKNFTIGELRNTGLRCSNGEYVIIFDDDDYHKKDRIEKQIDICLKSNIDGTILRNFQAVYQNKYYNVSQLRGLEGSILFRNDNSVRYPNMNQGEDTSMISTLKEKGYKIAIIDEEYNTYCYFYYGKNTVSRNHFLNIIKNKRKKLIISIDQNKIQVQLKIKKLNMILKLNKVMIKKL
jgi:glycosyltransferase involved in cell wall biosynthesis